MPFPGPSGLLVRGEPGAIRSVYVLHKDGQLLKSLFERVTQAEERNHFSVRQEVREDLFTVQCLQRLIAVDRGRTRWGLVRSRTGLDLALTT